MGAECRLGYEKIWVNLLHDNVKAYRTESAWIKIDVLS